jgi:hypothetical protein
MSDHDDEVEDTVDTPHLAPDTPADTLHSHVEKYISLPDAEKFENEPLMDELTQHPNLSSASIEKLYNHMMDSHTLDESGEAEPYSYEWADNLMKHPNTPLHIKKDYLSRTFHPDHPNSSSHEDLANSGIMNEDELRTMSDKAFKAGAIPHTYEQLPPDYYMQHWKEGSQNPEAQEGIGEYGLEGLINSKRHTPETLDRTIDSIHANKYHGVDEYSPTPDNASHLGRLVRAREDLSRAHLNKIHQLLESTPKEHDYSRHDAIGDILEHNNVDPALLAKYATNKDARREALQHPNLPKESIDAFIRRVKKPNDYDNKSKISNLLRNPSITKEQVKALIQKGSQDAIHHELADESDVRASWNGSDKSTDAARNILSAKQVPPDVLKEIVNHKNQDVAVQALNHDKADMSVVQEALKRKARTVQDAARLHPLVADQQVRERLSSGKTSISEVYHDDDFKSHFDKMPKEQQDEIFKAAHQKYAGADLEDIAKKTKERPETVLHSKLSMAMDSRVSPEIREKHAKDISTAFKKKIGKNKEFYASPYNVLHEQHNDDDSRLIRAVAELAQSGDKNAQEAVLSNPAMMQNLSSHIDLKKADPSFLDSAYLKAKEYAAKPPKIYDRHGRPKDLEPAHVIAPIFRSKNLSLDTFHDIAKNKDLMDAIGEGDELKRYDQLPEADQKARYSEILNSGSQEAAKSIIHTKAPAEIWDRALKMLPAEHRDEVLAENIKNVSEHRPDLFGNAVLGGFNHEGESRAQNAAVHRLNSLDVSHLNLAKQLIGTPAEMQGHLSDEDIMNSVSKSILTREGMIDHALATGRNDLASKMFGQRVRSQSQSLHNGQASKERAQGIMNEIANRMATIPNDDDNQVAGNWAKLLNNTKNYYGIGSDAFQTLKHTGGVNMDFLADMPGESGAQLRKLALQKDLISPEKVSEIAQTGSLADVLAIPNNAVKRTALDGWLSKPDLSPDDVSDISRSLNQYLLNPEAHTGGRSTSMSDNAFSEYSSRLRKLMDLSIDKSPDDLSNIIRNAFTSPSNVKELTDKDMDRISKDVLDHLSSRSYPSDQVKNESMYRAINALSRKDLVGEKTKSAFERQVMDSKDFNTLVTMAQEGNLSDKGMEFIARAVKSPGKLSSSEIAGISTQFSNSTEPKTVVEMAKTFEAKLAQERAEGKTRKHNEDTVKFISSLSHTFNASTTSSEEDKVKNDFVVNYTKKAALNPAVALHANSLLYKMAVAQSHTDEERSIDLLASLPNDRAAYNQFNPLNMSSIVNNPRFMEMAQSGVKLEMLAKNASKLTGNNASILVSRAMTTPLPEGNAQLMITLNKNKYVQMEDSVKLGRSLTDAEFRDVAESVYNALEGNLVDVAHSRLNSVQDLLKDPNLAAPGAPHLGMEHREAILNKLKIFSNVVANSTFTSDLSGVGGKLEKIDQMVDVIHESVQKIAASLRDETAKLGYGDSVRYNHQAIKGIAENIASANIKLGRNQAMKTFDMLKEFHSLDEAAGKKLTAPEETFGILTNIVSKAEQLEDQDWKSMFQSRPDAMFALSKRSSIPKEALASVDLRGIEDSKTGEGSMHQAFMVESSQWMNKMSSDDRAAYGKQLMDMYVRMHVDGKVQGDAYQNSMKTAIKSMARHMTRGDVQDIMVGTKDHSIAQSLFKEAVTNGAGGEETLKMYVRDHKKIMGTDLFAISKDSGSYEGSNIANRLEPVIRSPHINEEVSGRVCAMFVTNPEAMEAAMNKMLENPSVPQSSVDRIADQVSTNAQANHARFSESIGMGLSSQLLKHPNISEARLAKVMSQSEKEYGAYITHEAPFNPAFVNPTHGGKLFRAQPVVTPKDVPNVDGSLAVKTLNVKSGDYEKMREVMGFIPAEGMSWVEFKRKYPQQEKNLPKSVKDVFMAANNKPVMPERFVEAARQLDDNASKYHITFSDWKSPLQRHRGEDQKPNLVVQVNNSEEKERELSKDPKLWALYQHLLMDANGVDAAENSIGLHPTTPHLVSWSRVDTDQDKGSWVVEEYQSDFAQKFRSNLNALIESMPEGSHINGQHITADEMKQYSKTIARHLDDWADASMQAVIENAKAHGIKNLYMHGAELRGYLSNSDYNREFWDNKNTKAKMSGFRKIYEEGPRKYGFEECDYTDYPRYSSSLLGELNASKLSTKCWVLKLNAPDQRPKRKKKPNLR